MPVSVRNRGRYEGYQSKGSRNDRTCIPLITRVYSVQVWHLYILWYDRKKKLTQVKLFLQGITLHHFENNRQLTFQVINLRVGCLQPS